jgi:hypothetical protein
MSSVHVVIAHYKEDLDWIKSIKYPITVVTKHQYQAETIPNKGHEASSYLEYIITNYDKLSDYTIFVHGHRNAWHHKQNMDDKINALQFKHDYYNINDQGIGELIKFPASYSKMVELKDPVEKILSREIDFSKVVYRCSAQFYVKRETILQHPKETYQKLLDWIYNSKEPSFWTSRMFEYIWHIIFTGQYVDRL